MHFLPQRISHSKEDSVVYEPLLEQGEHVEHRRSKTMLVKHVAVQAVVVLIGCLIGVLIGSSIHSHSMSTGCAVDYLRYSPAQDVVSYQLRLLDTSFANKIRPYQGTPSEELDERWFNLYKDTSIAISQAQADHLTNKTSPAPGQEGKYLITLSMFHQLHCLNLLRKSLYPEYYPKTEVDHLDHCVDTLREAVTCTSDVTPLVWAWNDTRNKPEPQFNAFHVCRDFPAIQEWAHENRLEVPHENHVHAEGH
ncbi:hypothetical protein C8J56DRAFT_1158593 [Mycena floridula]|nr:hypothetical protein C8J56DRAFT_1158593 [Mycena floridula]